MARQLSYADAVKVLGADRSKIVVALDHLTGGLLLLGAATGSQFVLSLFDAKGELARISQELVIGLSDRMRGLSRYDRSQRLTAAHALLVITAYFESLTDISLPFDIRQLALSKSEQVALATGRPAGPSRLRDLADCILHSSIPTISANSSYDETLGSLRVFYSDLSRALQNFFVGLAFWDDLTDREKERTYTSLTRRFEKTLPDLAVTNYEKYFWRLATGSPEVAYWTIFQANRATHAEVRELRTQLINAIEEVRKIEQPADSSPHRRSLAKAHQGALNRPIISAGDVPEGIVIPTLSAIYINPAFRVAAIDSLARPGDESWWKDLPDYDDLLGFLLGHFTSLKALEAPLVVLGQPGSGKSVLTKYLAARLPVTDFLVIRIVLRDAPAEADLQSQIEHAIRSSTGEPIGWAELVRSAGDALPVILIDGFDELLQATGVSQSDYLAKVAAFQQRELDQGKPVAVLVTSRTAVANYARFPIGTLAARLEPFTESQIEQWLRTWNQVNLTYWTANGVQPLTLESVLSREELATQPLLLLMIALYAADSGDYRESAGLSQSDIYERLLTRFAEREIRKSNEGLLDASLHGEVERELLRLSIVGFAMFNRGRQWVSEIELEADLISLLKGGIAPRNVGMRTPLTAAQIVVGRFFFVHEAQATRDGALLKTYEFLHATFGEYLIARLVARELADLCDFVEFNTSHVRSAPTDDRFLYALLSYIPLSARGPIIAYLAELTIGFSDSRRTVVNNLLLDLFERSLDFRDNESPGYRPLEISTPRRLAAYSANMLLLYCLTSGGPIHYTDMLADEADPVDAWRSLSLFWRSQFSSDNWTSFVSALHLERVWDGERRDIRLMIKGQEIEQEEVDLYWTFGIGPGDAERGRKFWMVNNAAAMRRESRFVCDRFDDLMAHAMEPFAGELGMVWTSFAALWPDRCISAAHALVRMWMLSAQGAPASELTLAYETCLDIANSELTPWDEISKDRYLFLVARQFTYDASRLPESWVNDGPGAKLRTPDMAPWMQRLFEERGSAGPTD